MKLQCLESSLQDYLYVYIYGSDKMIYLPFKKRLGTLVDDDYTNPLHCFNWFESCGGYVCTSIYLGPNKKKLIKLHRFVMNFPEHLVVHHINNNKLDNRTCNLEAITQAENNRHRKFR